MGQDHRRLDSKVIAQHIFMMVKVDPTISIRVLQGGVDNPLWLQGVLQKGFQHRESLLEYMAIGRSYTMSFLVGYLLCRMNLADLTENVSLGTWVQLVTQPWPGSADTIMFNRVFWTFPSCVEAFKHYKPLIFIDGTHLYGKYGGTLLMAIAQDGNSRLVVTSL
ncbi:uncharacterized protein [Arachis hypogaea]|uniref:uncharacterized protein n=1 Tax=Arachis hypogaea TaxID=3818 RepID=UPI000DED232A|nr:uncharacterized protein LOC112709049 [Arachis hypogaea]